MLGLRLSDIVGLFVALLLVGGLAHASLQEYWRYTGLEATRQRFQEIVTVFDGIPPEARSLSRVVLKDIKGPSYVSSKLLPKVLVGTSIKVDAGHILTVVRRVRPRKRGKPRVTLRISLQNTDLGVEYRFYRVNAFRSEWVVRNESE